VFEQRVEQIAVSIELPYFFEFKTRLFFFSHFSELKIRARLKFEVFFLSLSLFKSLEKSFSSKNKWPC
jgi:hypothetical protein